MKKIYILLLSPILIFGFLYIVYSSQNGVSLKTNINTQHNTIVEFYKYINLHTSAIPEEYISRKNTNMIVEELSNRTKNYNSRYSDIEFIVLNEDKKEKKSLLGKYLFTFNSNTVNFTPIEGEKSNNEQFFKCELNIYLYEGLLENQIPLCNYNNNQSFNIEFNQKIKESVILSHINSLLYSYNELPLKLPEKSSTINNLSKRSTISNLGNIIKEIKIINLTETETEFSLKFGSKITTDKEKIESFKKDNKIITLKLTLQVVSQYDINKIENCFIDIYQPWYLLLPDTLYSSVASCEVVN